METPAYYPPGRSVSSYAKRLVKAWVMTLKRLTSSTTWGRLSIGSIFDEDCRAACEQFERVWAGLLPVAGRDRQEPEISTPDVQGSGSRGPGGLLRS